MSGNRHYYMQLQTAGDVQDIIDIEATFEGLYVNDVEGLLNKGEAKNIYIETFADMEDSKVYMPDVVYREPTTVTMTLSILASNFVEVYGDFLTYIAKDKLKLWDDMRTVDSKSVEVELLFTAAVSPDDILTEGQERIEVEIEFQNLKGDYTLKTD